MAMDEQTILRALSDYIDSDVTVENVTSNSIELSDGSEWQLLSHEEAEEVALEEIAPYFASTGGVAAMTDLPEILINEDATMSVDELRQFLTTVGRKPDDVLYWVDGVSNENAYAEHISSDHESWAEIDGRLAFKVR